MSKSQSNTWTPAPIVGAFVEAAGSQGKLVCIRRNYGGNKVSTRI